MPGSVDFLTRSMQAASIAIGSSEARMPMSCMHGSSATAQQSQSTDMLHMMLIKAILSPKCLTTDEAASAMASRN